MPSREPKYCYSIAAETKWRGGRSAKLRCEASISLPVIGNGRILPGTAFFQVRKRTKEGSTEPAIWGNSFLMDPFCISDERIFKSKFVEIEWRLERWNRPF